MNIFQRKYFFLLIWVGLIAYASLSPSNSFPKITIIPHIDKVVHFCMYLGLAFLIIPAHLKDHRYFRSYLFSLFITIFLGILFEILQKYITLDRSASFYDAAADALGAILGIVTYKIMIEKRKIEFLLFKIQ